MGLDTRVTTESQVAIKVKIAIVEGIAYISFCIGFFKSFGDYVLTTPWSF